MEVRVEVHEEDVLVLLVSNGLTHGLEVHFGSLESLDVDICRFGGILGGGVEDSSGLNPEKHGGGLELLLKGSPQLMGGGLSLEHRLVVWGDLEVDESLGKLVLLQPCVLILSIFIRLLLLPIDNVIQVSHPKDHIHLKLPLEPVIRGKGSSSCSQSGEFLGIGGHSECRGR